MSKYTFISHQDPTNRFDTTEVTFKVDSCNLSDLLEQFARFLGAAGFSVGPSDELELWTAEDRRRECEWAVDQETKEAADEVLVEHGQALNGLDDRPEVVGETMSWENEKIFKNIDEMGKQVLSTGVELSPTTTEGVEL